MINSGNDKFKNGEIVVLNETSLHPGELGVVTHQMQVGEFVSVVIGSPTRFETGQIIGVRVEDIDRTGDNLFHVESGK